MKPLTYSQVMDPITESNRVPPSQENHVSPLGQSAAIIFAAINYISKTFGTLLITYIMYNIAILYQILYWILCRIWNLVLYWIQSLVLYAHTNGIHCRIKFFFAQAASCRSWSLSAPNALDSCTLFLCMTIDHGLFHKELTWEGPPIAPHPKVDFKQPDPCPTVGS